MASICFARELAGFACCGSSCKALIHTSSSDASSYRKFCLWSQKVERALQKQRSFCSEGFSAGKLQVFIELPRCCKADIILGSPSKNQEAQPQLGRTISLWLAKGSICWSKESNVMDCGEGKGAWDPPARSHPCIWHADCYLWLPGWDVVPRTAVTGIASFLQVFTDLADTVIAVWSIFSHCRRRRGDMGEVIEQSPPIQGFEPSSFLSAGLLSKLAGLTLLWLTCFAASLASLRALKLLHKLKWKIQSNGFHASACWHIPMKWPYPLLPVK